MGNKFKEMVAISICFYIAVFLAFVTYYENKSIFDSNSQLMTFYWGTFACFNITVISSISIPYIWDKTI